MASLFDKIKTLVKARAGEAVDRVSGSSGVEESSTEAIESALAEAKERLRSAEKNLPEVSTENMSDEVKQSAAEARELAEKAKRYVERKEAELEIAREQPAAEVAEPTEVVEAVDSAEPAAAAPSIPPVPPVPNVEAELPKAPDVTKSVEAAHEKAADVRKSLSKAEEVIARDQIEAEATVAEVEAAVAEEKSAALDVSAPVKDSVDIAKEKAEDVRRSVAKAEDVIEQGELQADIGDAHLDILTDDPSSVASEILGGGVEDSSSGSDSAESSIDDIKRRLG